MTFKHSIRPYFKKPQRLKRQPSLTVSQIVRRLSKDVMNKAKRVGIEEAYEGRTPAFLKGYTTYKFVTRNTENGHRYRLTIFSPTPRVTLDTTIIVDDPCPVFVFRYEYAMAKRGNAYIYRSNGDAPEVTNPGLKPGLSHHGVRAVQYLIKHTTKNGLALGRQRR